MLIKPPMRTSDIWGDGHYHASRGNRFHKGIDLACCPGSKILSPVTGVVTKIGYPYADDLRFRYVQITTRSNIRHRIFYIEPDGYGLGSSVVKDLSILGVSQSLDNRYPGITEHIHLEIKDESGEFLDPTGTIT